MFFEVFPGVVFPYRYASQYPFYVAGRILIEDEAGAKAAQTQSDRVLDLAAGSTSGPAKLLNEHDAKAGAMTCPSKLGYRVR